MLGCSIPTDRITDGTASAALALNGDSRTQDAMTKIRTGNRRVTIRHGTDAGPCLIGSAFFCTRKQPGSDTALRKKENDHDRQRDKNSRQDHFGLLDQNIHQTRSGR